MTAHDENPLELFTRLGEECRTHDESVWRLVRMRFFPQRVAGTRRWPPQAYFYALLLELRLRSWR